MASLAHTFAVVLNSIAKFDRFPELFYIHLN